ncbi:MAG: acyl-CoA dehydrogenase family protein [Nitrospirae bacterium]|nr:acyl-CoA dehydrogenase family protein [Nitrospirota bacterium]
MDFTFSSEHIMLRETARRFVDRELRPIAQQIDKEREVPRSLITKAGAVGLLGVPFPETYGGSGLGEIGYCVLLEEIGRACASTSVTIGAHVGLACFSILLGGNEEQKRRYLPRMISGEWLGAYALTEAGAGSDAASIQTEAIRDGDDFILNGTKLWISNGDIADVIVVYAVTDAQRKARGGITAFLVERTSPGFSAHRIHDKMGIRGSSTAELVLDHVRVPKENVLGEMGAGFVLAMKTLDESRLSLGAACVGAGKELIQLSTDFAKKRHAFGQPIAQFQAIQWMLADMAAEVYLMESAVYRTAWMYDQGLRITRESAIAKLYASEALCRIADKAVQIHGGMGYMGEHPVERFYRDARINRIFEGTNEIQRLVIAEDLLKQAS